MEGHARMAIGANTFVCKEAKQKSRSRPLSSTETGIESGILRGTIGGEPGVKGY